MKSPITTHVLDIARGRPARGVRAVLDALGKGETWETLGEGTTDEDGRIDDFSIEKVPLSPGTYRLTFDVSPYFQSNGVESFFSSIPIVFTIKNLNRHTHVPLLLSPFGYSTYRGS